MVRSFADPLGRTHWNSGLNGAFHRRWNHGSFVQMRWNWSEKSCELGGAGSKPCAKQLAVSTAKKKRQAGMLLGVEEFDGIRKVNGL